MPEQLTLSEAVGTLEDLIDAFWDMSPLEYAASRGLSSMSDYEGERIKQEARNIITRYKESS